MNGLEIQESSGLYFKEQVRRELVERFGWQRVYQGGLRVYTTHRSRSCSGRRDARREGPGRHRAAAAATSTRKRGKDAPIKEGSLPQYLQGALVAMDPTTGYVRAMVGGRDFDESRFNRAMQAKRQSGLGVQAVRVCDGARSRLLARDRHRQPERSDRDAAGRLGPGGRALDGRLDDAADGAADVEQPRRRAAA